MSTIKASNIQPPSDSDPLIFSTNATQRVRVGSDGLVGIGISGPVATLHVDGTSRVSDSGVKPSGGNAVFSVVSTVPVTAATTAGITLASFLSNNSDGSDYRPRLFVTATSEGIVLNESYNTTATNLMFAIGHVEKMRLTANGEIGIGTTSPVAKLDVRGTVSISDTGVFPVGSAAPLYNRLLVGGTGAAIFVWDDGSSVAVERYGRIGLGSRNSQSGVTLAGGYIDGGNEGTTDHSGFLKFFTTPANGSANVERMRINSSGFVGIGITLPQTLLHVKGASVFFDGHTIGNSTSNVPLYLRYKGTNIGGTFLVFQANSATSTGTYTDNNYPTGDNVGSIVCNSSGVMTYNTFCGSHWSSIVDGNDDILPGTVLQSVGETNGNHLPKTKISDTPNSTAVYGVFYGKLESGICVASLGAYFIRIAANATVSIGDLLVSDGTGCAVPQQDDLIRSRTIGKVTSAIPLETYEDGSYTVPAVLYCG